MSVVAGLAAGAAGSAALNITTYLGITDPRQWSPKSWASDIVPHLAYGMVTAAAYEAIADD